jgi:hypothetical protein
MRKNRSAAKPQPKEGLTTDYMDHTDKRNLNPCIPCNPWFKIFPSWQQIGLLHRKNKLLLRFLRFFAALSRELCFAARPKQFALRFRTLGFGFQALQGRA